MIQVEQIERRLAPIVAGLAASPSRDRFLAAFTLIDEAISEFDTQLTRTTGVEPVLSNIQQLQREAGIL